MTADVPFVELPEVEAQDDSTCDDPRESMLRNTIERSNRSSEKVKDKESLLERKCLDFKRNLDSFRPAFAQMVSRIAAIVHRVLSFEKMPPSNPMTLFSKQAEKASPHKEGAPPRPASESALPKTPLTPQSSGHTHPKAKEALSPASSKERRLSSEGKKEPEQQALFERPELNAEQREPDGDGGRNGSDEEEAQKKRTKSGSSIKPVLEKPKLGVFALFYLLDKMHLESESQSYGGYKKEIELNDKEATFTHKKMLEEMKIALEKERETERWTVAVKVFSWMGSMTGLITGLTLMATGVGVVAGVMLVAASILQITNQMMEITGGWRKIVELLPSDDVEKKRAVIAWIQISITLICVILSGVGIVFGGYSNLGEGMQLASSLFGGTVTMAGGATTIGRGVSEFLYTNRRADERRHAMRLEELKHKRQDLMESIEEAPDRLEKLFESLANNLNFLEEINAAYQKAWR